MQPRTKEATQQGPEDNEKLHQEALGSTDLEESAFLVKFGPDDAENPLNWSTKLKWGVTAAVSGTGFTRIMVSTVRQNLPAHF